MFDTDTDNSELDTELDGEGEGEGEVGEEELSEEDQQALLEQEGQRNQPKWKSRFKDEDTMFKSYRAAERQLTRVSQEAAETKKRLEQMESMLASGGQQNKQASPQTPDLNDLTEKQLDELAKDPVGFMRRHFNEFSQQSQVETEACGRSVERAMDEVAVHLTEDSEFAELFEEDPSLVDDMWKYCAKHPVLSYLMDQVGTHNFKNFDLREYYKPIMEMGTKMALADRLMDKPNIRAEVKREVKTNQLIKNRLVTNQPGSRSKNLGASGGNRDSDIKSMIRAAVL